MVQRNFELCFIFWLSEAPMHTLHTLSTTPSPRKEPHEANDMRGDISLVSLVRGQ